MFPLEFFRRIARRFRLVAYDVIGGKRTGYVSLEAGIHFDQKTDLTLGRGVWLDRFGIIKGTGRVTIGEYTYIGAQFSIFCLERITIGSECMFGANVSVIDNNHGMALGTPMRLQPLPSKPITIGNDVWLANNVTVLPGVTIGDGAIVAAGAVVRSDVAPRSIVGGVPARFIRMRE